MNKKWCLISRPTGDLTVNNFKFEATEIPTPGENQFLIRNIYLSLDPAMRVWVRERESYIPPVKIGDVMRAFTLGVVEKSNNPAYPVGCIASGVFGLEDYSISDGTGVVSRVEMDPRLPLTARFGLFEHIGLTAYFGIYDLLHPKLGETMVVSGAAGAVGSIAVQIGKIMGCRVVAIAGTKEKCDWLKDELGADAVINYRTEPLRDSLSKACPNGVDTYFDNVGGETLEAVLDIINVKARIALCGAVSQLNAGDKPYAPNNLLNLVTQRGRMEGFIVLDYAADQRWWAKAHEDITQWYLQGRMKYRVDVVEGLEKAPEAIGKLFKGTNNGKLLIQISEEPARG